MINTLAKIYGTNPNAKRLDELDYRYYAGTNRLEYIDDNVPQGNWPTDLDDQGSGNYAYDATGNLISDNKEKITEIKWTVYGKVKKINFLNKTKPVINFTYDAHGNRVIKELKYPSPCAHSFTSPKPCNPNPNDVKTFYVRDASGNIMAIYEKTEEQNKYKYRLKTEEQNKYKYRLKEIPLYGSTMLGEYKPDILVKEVTINNGNITIPTLSATNLFSRNLSKREYTVNDHLSSVRSVLSDKKFATITGGAPTDFTGEVMSVSNTYPFGMQQPGRTYNTGDYRFGFNGKEKVDEISGSGNYYDFDARMYDPRICRPPSIDPLFRNFPEFSPYQFFNNNPIWLIEPTGKQAIPRPSPPRRALLNNPSPPELKPPEPVKMLPEAKVMEFLRLKKGEDIYWKQFREYTGQPDIRSEVPEMRPVSGTSLKPEPTGPLTPEQRLGITGLKFAIFMQNVQKTLSKGTTPEKETAIKTPTEIKTMEVETPVIKSSEFQDIKFEKDITLVTQPKKEIMQLK
ncbi:MAG: hypothetical protein HYY40_05475 [Bacteroidetes bacterium]|nr:hypothetical protein [Bacteroidota bacterium]